MKNNNIFKILTLCLITGLLGACSSNSTTDREQEVINEIESIESALDQTTEELDAEIEDMNHDVDSLLEGI